MMEGWKFSLFAPSTAFKRHGVFTLKVLLTHYIFEHFDCLPSSFVCASTRVNSAQITRKRRQKREGGRGNNNFFPRISGHKFRGRSTSDPTSTTPSHIWLTLFAPCEKTSRVNMRGRRVAVLVDSIWLIFSFFSASYFS